MAAKKGKPVEASCPKCGCTDEPERTNRYLVRCVNYAECGSYW